MTTLHLVELGVLGPLEVRQAGLPVSVPGAKPRAILTMLGLHDGSVVSADSLVELLWGDDPPRTAAKALQTHISLLRRTLGDGFVLTQGAGWTLAETEVDAARYKTAARLGRDAAAADDDGRAVVCFDEALALWRGVPELPDGRRGTPEKTRWIEAHAALVEDRADALLATGRAAEIVGELEAAVADAPLRERRWGQLMLALYRAGRQGEALGAYQRARALLADELGVDPGPNLRRLEALIVAQDAALEAPATQRVSSVTRAVTFLLTDIEGSTAAWEANAGAMAVALARHDELVEQVVTSRGGRLIKTRGEGDATFSVFDRPSAAAAAAIELQDAVVHEPWALSQPMRIRVALHTGEAELRDGDYFGRAVNRAARLRSLAVGGQILCSGATAELVIDSLPDHVALADLGQRELRNLARPEHVFELRLATAGDHPQPASPDVPMERPALPAVLAGPGPFVGRGNELQRLLSVWQTVLAGGTSAVLIAGEPGVGKTRLAGEWSRQAYDQGALVIYGRCDEDLGAPYQPFAEALRALVPCLGAGGLRGLRGVEALLALVPGLTDILPDLAAPTRADPDTERYALFDAVVAVLGVVSASAPVVLILDDLHWAAKPTLLLLRHLLRFGERARVQIIGTYRSTDLDRAHPLAAMLADLHRDGSANRIQLSGLDEDDVTAYVAEAGYHDEELARALASVTGGNPFFLIEALRHVDESGGRWDQSTLPQGVREAVSRRLTRLLPETNKALAAAAVVGSRFDLELVERVVGDDLVDAFDEACKAGIVIEEPGGRYRFNHALVRQSLLAELPSVRRMRLHQRIAATLESQPGADDELLAELAHHYFECAWAGNAAKAVEYCRRAADQAMARLAYEGAADLYDHALHALEEIDDELPDRDDQAAELLVARCEALLAAGDVASAAGAVAQLQGTTVDSARLAAWATCFDGQLSMLIHPERLDEVEAALSAAAAKLAELDDAAGEAKAHTVRAGCLARLGRIGDCEVALDDALTAARRAHEHRRVNNVLANAPLAALWGPNPVPRAGGRCLDVVRLLRITTDSPAVEATSTRCQAVLEAFRGRAAAARRMIDSARRTVTELGLRHALLEVEQFAGIVELVVDEPAAAEPHLLKAYNGFRRMGLDADTAETAALLGRACLLLDRDAEAAELCAESERLAGHALKPSIAWRTLRAQLLARSGDHGEARRIAEAAVSLAERTDALVDHGDACLTLAMVAGAAGDVSGARAAAERAVGLYERKGAAALAEKARVVLGERDQSAAAAAPSEAPLEGLDNACVRAGERVLAAIARQTWDEIAQMYAPNVLIESRRKIVGFPPMSSDDWVPAQRPVFETGDMRMNQVVIAVRGERLALSRLKVESTDVSPGAPYDEFLNLYGIDDEGRFALQVWFDLDDIDTAMAELDAMHARFEDEHPRARRLENAATRVDDQAFALFAESRWDELSALYADDMRYEDRRQGLRRSSTGRAAQMSNVRAIAATGDVKITLTPLALRGDRLYLCHMRFELRDPQPDAFKVDILQITEVDDGGVMVAQTLFEIDDFDAAIGELDARYAAGEAAPYTHTWSAIAAAYTAMNRGELPATTPDWVNIDHRRGAAFAPGDLAAYIRATFDVAPDVNPYIEDVHQLSNLGAVVTHASHATSQEGFDAEWRYTGVVTVEGDLINRCELFDDEDIDAAIAKFEQLTRPAPRLENAAARVFEHVWSHFARHDWDALAETVADNYAGVDHRRVVSAETQHGRDAVVKDLQAAADVGFAISMVSAVAIRGERLVLARVRASGHDPEAIQNDALNVVEIDDAERIAKVATFDLDDFDAAVAELDARYIAGEAAPYADTWPVIAGTYASISRREFPALTSDCVSIDHRRAAAFAPGELTAYIRAGWEIDQDIRPHVEAIHRLSNLGAVVTYAAHGNSREGFDAEWREVALVTVKGNMVNRTELFDEADLDAAVARFDQLSQAAPRLENRASQVTERFLACFPSREWDAAPEILADNFRYDDRRRVVGAGVRDGRNAYIADMRAAADFWTPNVPNVMATRGERLALARLRFSGRDQGPEAFVTDVLGIAEINTDGRLVGVVSFDPNDFDAALGELDARYLAGEAAAHAHTWSVITRAYAALNRREPPATTPDWVNVDHRRGISFAPGAVSALLANWNSTADLSNSVEAVHRLTDFGAVVTSVSYESSSEGFEAEWRGINVLTVDGDLIDRLEIFDEADLDAALARFEELGRPTPRLENAATRAYERLQAYYAAPDWAAIAELLSDDYTSDDRRAVVGSGIQQGREALIENLRAVVDVGVAHATSETIATRGGRLALTHARFSRSHQEPEAFHVDYLQIIEMDAGERITALAAFGPGEFGAAIAELDARYLAGEAAAYSHAWSIIAGSYAALNRHELPPTTADCVYTDHRRETAFGPGDLTAYLGAGWDSDQSINVYVEQVHRLNNLGAVITYVAHETSHEGFAAEWRGIAVLTVGGDLVNRVEVFDEADLDAALARFDELSSQTTCLDNAASQVGKRYLAYFETADWDAMAEMLADNFSNEDRRRVVGIGLRSGRGAQIADMRALADLFSTKVTSATIATRGAHLALMRLRFSASDHESEAFVLEAAGVLEINADERIVAVVFFDVDDFDAALDELDARYLAGEAAAHARTWSFVTRANAAFNRRKVPAKTPDCVYTDHRRLVGIEEGGLGASLRALWEQLTPQARIYIESVHRLSDIGAVVTHTAHATSREGFDAEWREINLLTAEGDLVNRCELFDEGDIDGALARFEELRPEARRLENAASRTFERFLSHFAARDWDAMAATPADNFAIDDRRRVVNAGIRHGRANAIHDWRAAADVGFSFEVVGVIATRGERIALLRVRASGRDPESIRNDAFNIIETNADERVVGAVVFDLDDIDAAFEELDARYLAGEAAAHAHTWSAILRTYAAANRHQLQLTPDCVTIDHRRARAFAPGELAAYMHATWDLAPEVTARVEAVHRLTSRGAVVTQVVHGTSKEGFDAEWREVILLTVAGDMINRAEMFDEADLDAALARFEELRPQAPPLKNAASQVAERFWKYFGARDWAAMAKIVTSDFINDDRRHVVGAGAQHGSDATIADMRVIADIWVKDVTSTVIATRGTRLALMRIAFSSQNQGPEAFISEIVAVAEIAANELLVAAVSFDPDDIDAAFAELEARYLDGEAAPHAGVWKFGVDTIAELNRHEPGPNLRQLRYVDHRRIPFASGSDFGRGVEELWALVPDARYRVPCVHALDNRGTVVTFVIEGTDNHGNELQWRRTLLFASEGPRLEVYEEDDLDAALARFEELRPQARRLENAASRTFEHFLARYVARDWDAVAEMLADDLFNDDRRRVVSAGVLRGRDATITSMRASAALGISTITSNVIATRGGRIALSCDCFSGRDQQTEMFFAEVLGIVEIDADGRIVARIAFDIDDIDAAFEELEKRYLAGEAASHADVWSVVAEVPAQFNRHELFATTADPAYIDHRRLVSIEGADLAASVRAVWDITSDASAYIEAVHRLTERGAVFTELLKMTSRDGFDAEMWMTMVFTIEGGLISRVEVFDEQDLDAALNRFDELQPPDRLLGNIASRLSESFFVYAESHEWDAMAEIVAEDSFFADRRRVVNFGVWRGRDAVATNMRVLDEVEAGITLTIIATRGERLALTYLHSLNRDLRHGEFDVELLSIVEADADNRIATLITFDPNDIDTAFAELDARYLAGEASAHAQTWSVLMRAFAALNRREIPATTPDWVRVDHRSLAPFEAGEWATFLQATWDVTSNLTTYIEAVHRLSDLGLVVTHASHGTSQDGMDAEWRIVDIFTVDGELISRAELFDEADLNAALARFDELDRSRPNGNAATRIWSGLADAFNRRDLDGFFALTTADLRYEDRRRGLRDEFQGPARRKNMQAMFEAAPSGSRLTVETIAIRGRRLSLTRAHYGDPDDADAPTVEMLQITEVGQDGLLHACVSFDPHDIDAAFAELDARYLAGEAAPCSQVWTVITRGYGAFNRREQLPTTADWVNIDRRRALAVPPGEMTAYVHAAWDLEQDVSIYIEAVHRLSELGAVVTHATYATSLEGFQAEWRIVLVLKVIGDMVDHCEIFDEADIDAALARFDELDRPTSSEH